MRLRVRRRAWTVDCDGGMTRWAPRRTVATPTLRLCCGCLLLLHRAIEREDGEHAALVRELARVAERAERAEARGRIFGADAGGDADARPATDAREHGDVLLAVGPHVRHRVADDARRGLELPDLLTGLGVERLEPALHRAVED